jgi:uncharacterized Tic20 family protein
MDSFEPSSFDAYPDSRPVPAGKDDRNWAVIAHLSAFAGHFFPFGQIIGPLVIWLVKRDSSPFVDDQAKEALNAQISYTFYGVVAAILVLVLIGFALLLALWIADIALVILAAISASKGRAFRYPLIIRLVT